MYKGGDTNAISNYHAIMVGSIFEKLYGTIMENNIIQWEEKHVKEAIGQAGLRPTTL